MADVHVDRKAVLTAWTAVVAERIDFASDEALTLAGAVGRVPFFQDPAGGPVPPAMSVEPVIERGRIRVDKGYVEIMQREVPVLYTADGIRALATPHRPISPERVAAYLRETFGEQLEPTLEAMRRLARAYPPTELAARATELYTEFRAALDPDQLGWLPEATLDLDRITRLASRARMT